MTTTRPLTTAAMTAPSLSWIAGAAAPVFDEPGLVDAIHAPRQPAYIVRGDNGGIGVGRDGALSSGTNGADWPLLGLLPPLYPEWLGDRSFQETYGTRYPYVGGAMANGIASASFVIELGKIGALGMFGAAGLAPARVEAAINTIAAALDPLAAAWGANLIHSPAEPALEDAIVDLYLRRGVRCVEASAFMAMSPAIVRYAASGLQRDGDGRIQRRNHVIAKISREEVARRFLEPPTAKMLDALVDAGRLSRAEADLAAQLPIADDLTCESDSGGHTDNRPLGALLPTILRLRDEIVAKRGDGRIIRVGAAGGLGTPNSVAAAFALGAAYVQTGSVNQACVEAGLHPRARAMLAKAGMADVIMAPAADMFEMGVEVQVLKRGTLFAPRARKLYELYRAYPSFAAMPQDDRDRIERQMLRNDYASAWASTRAFWLKREPAQVERADRDAKHQMALVFRSYLGLASRWAIDGVEDRESDYQIWCGPAMGAFNRWVEGSFLDPPEARTVAQVALNLLEGATVVTRALQLRSYGVPVPAAAFDFRPRPLA
ncbi:MAG: PfaD family polyunsaturated fatty acid/polyketide biosynthesis protein [Xanthomonadales bacterium]|nr:PfaD family polyunsaturated fatty acid/polyketide biosynthesis protein [Xanthomonadales bacterium]